MALDIKGNIVELQKEATLSRVVRYFSKIQIRIFFNEFSQILVSTICALNSASQGLVTGFSSAGLAAYSTPNATSLEKPLNENQISWFSE